MTKFANHTITALALAALHSAAGCAVDDASRGSGAGINQITQGLTTGALESANGTYGGDCRNRSGDWSVDIAGGATLDHEPLSVILNDIACELTLTELRLTTGALAAEPAMGLTTSYLASPSSFGTSLYANAKLSAATFAGDFTITVLYSDDPELATSENTANFSVVTSSAIAASVPAPSYTLAVDNLIVQTDVNDVVQSVSGSASLTAGSVTGQRYTVVSASGLDTYAELDAAYTASNSALTATIPAADFALTGSDLTSSQVRTLVIANISNGVRSYQAFEITFRAAL